MNEAMALYDMYLVILLFAQAIMTGFVADSKGRTAAWAFLALIFPVLCLLAVGLSEAKSKVVYKVEKGNYDGV